MKALLIYVAGFLTPFLLLAALHSFSEFQEWQHRRRYKRAWDRFSTEFDALPEPVLEGYKKVWAEAPYRYESFCDDRSRYFSMKWNYGYTKEV